MTNRASPRRAMLNAILDTIGLGLIVLVAMAVLNALTHPLIGLCP